MLKEISMDPHITKQTLSEKLGVSTTAVDNNIAFLRRNGYIGRVGKTKGGYWKILK